MVLEDVNKFGMGLRSLLVDYRQVGTKHLVDALNDPDVYGQVARSLLRAQVQLTGTLPVEQLQPSLARWFLRVRQLSAAQQAGL